MKKKPPKTKSFTAQLSAIYIGTSTRQIPALPGPLGNSGGEDEAVLVQGHRSAETHFLGTDNHSHATINSHPMTRIDAMADDGVEALPPYHFTTRRVPAAIIVDTTKRFTITIYERWIFVQELRHQLWRRYFKEYVSLLQRFHLNKYKGGKKCNLQVGDIVFVKDGVLFSTIDQWE